MAPISFVALIHGTLMLFAGVNLFLPKTWISVVLGIASIIWAIVELVSAFKYDPALANEEDIGHLHKIYGINEEENANEPVEARNDVSEEERAGHFDWSSMRWNDCDRDLLGESDPDSSKADRGSKTGET